MNLMNLMHLGFLAAGAAAMTLPLWIHLLLRQRARSVDIGSIRNYSEPMSTILADESRKLTDIEGVGKDLAQKIETLYLASLSRKPRDE